MGKGSSSCMLVKHLDYVVHVEDFLQEVLHHDF